jgi:hypothetical protein
MVWEGTPRSVWDSHRKVRDSYDSLEKHGIVLLRGRPEGAEADDHRPDLEEAADTGWRLRTNSHNIQEKDSISFDWILAVLSPYPTVFVWSEATFHGFVFVKQN